MRKKTISPERMKLLRDLEEMERPIKCKIKKPFPYTIKRGEVKLLLPGQDFDIKKRFIEGLKKEGLIE